MELQREEEKILVIKTWKEEKISKVNTKTQKKLNEILGWEKKKTTKIESELDRIQRNMDIKKMEKTEKLKNKKVLVHVQAQEKKAKVQTKRAQKILDAEEEAARFREMGQVPNNASLSCC